MPRDSLLTRIEVDRIHCHDEGDGPGSAEPYLWTVFFKVDGENVAVNSALSLTGEGTIQVTPGSHGNLPNSDVDDGEDIAVPSSIGEWQSVLQPIPVPDSLSGVVDDVGGVLGVVAVLMEEDNVTDDGAEAGHQALNQAVRDAISQVIATRTVTNQDVSDEELAAFEEQITQSVRDAIADQQNFFANIWSWLNADDTIGFRVFTFTHDRLADGGTIEFSQRWVSEGDWEIFGSVTAVPMCPAELLQAILDELLGESPTDLDRLRDFRDGTFRQHEGLLPWWRMLERNTPALSLLFVRDTKLARAAAELWRFATTVVADLESPIDVRRLEAAAQLAREVSRRTRSRRLRVDAARAGDLLPLVRGRTGRDVITALARFEPARNQRHDDAPPGTN